MKIEVEINGAIEIWTIEPDEYLADTLRNHGYTSVKTSCYDGACGSCTVFIEDKPMLSCIYLSAKADGKKITTIEGVEEEAKKVAEALVKRGSEGCGYCAPGFIMQVIAMKRELKNPSLEEIKDYLNGNLCRCTGYVTRNEAAIEYLRMEEKTDE